MKLAVLSDIHGNLEAFTSVLVELKSFQSSEMVCLGDAIGYGPEPEAVVRIIRERNIPMVLGNHEQGAADAGLLCRFNPQARDALRRTVCLMEPETIAWCSARPRFLVRDGLRFVHGCPPDRVTTYFFTIKDAALPALFQRFPEDICFVGHTHELGLAVFDGRRAWREDLPDRAVLPRGLRHIVNVGAVGQPRDGDNRAKYVTWEPDSRTLTVHRVPYNIRKTVDRIIELGLPRVYADRLW